MRGPGLKELRNLERLAALTLDGAPLDAGSLVENISGLNNLVFLSVVDTDVTAAIVDKLDLPKLKNVRWEGTPAKSALESVEQ